MAGADVVSAETMSHGTPVVARRARAASVGSWGDWRGRSPLSLSGTPAGQSGGSLSVPASNKCSEREASADVWPRHPARVPGEVLDRGEAARVG